MGSSVRISLNRQTVKNIAKSEEMKTLIGGIVHNIAAHANAIGDTTGFEPRVRVGKTRVRGSVVSVTNEARRAEARKRALSKALGASRG